MNGILKSISAKLKAKEQANPRMLDSKLDTELILTILA